MRISRVVRIVSVCLAAVVVGAVLSVWLLWPSIVTYGTVIHQKAVTKELAEWGEQYSTISDDASAIRAAEMVAYMNWYYVPASGYRGPADVEAALEAQRRKSIDQVVASLERYTGLKYGANAKRWAEWGRQKAIETDKAPLNDPTSRHAR